MLCKLSYGQGRPSKKKHIFGHVISLVGENVSIFRKFPGLLHTPAKYEKKSALWLRSYCKRKCGSDRFASPIYKHISPHTEIKSLIILAVTLLL